MGLRELKKKKTRKAISDMATRLFIERGYNEVTTAEIAERAEVSVPTLFNYFPTKESLVFDEDFEMEAELVSIVTDRKKGQTILEALLEGGLRHIESMPERHRKNFKLFMNLVVCTPALNLYSKQMWMRHEKSLAKVIRKESKRKITELEAEALSGYVLESYHRVLGAKQPKESLRVMFGILMRGWIE